MSSKRIGLMLDSLVGGGAERITLNFADKFAKLGHDVHIFVIAKDVHHKIDNDAYLIHFLSNDGKVYNNRFLNKRVLANKLQKLVRDIEEDGKKFDFFISSAEDSDRLSKIAKLKNVYIRYRNSMLHYINHKIGQKGPTKTKIRRFRWFTKFRRIYNNRNIITVSKALIEEITKEVGVKPKSIVNIYNPFDFDRIRHLGSLYDSDIPNEPYIVYVAKLENRKRQDLLLQAFAKAKPKRKLVLIGDSYTASDKRWEKHLHELTQSLKIAEQVIFTGFKPNPYPWIKNADLFAMASDSEGLPTVLIESFILGTPVVSTDCPTGPSEILTGNLAKYLSPIDDIDALAQNITAALHEYPSIEEKMLTQFSADYSIQRYLEHCCKEA